MPSSLRYRFWLESAFATVSGVLAAVTTFWYDWIEAVFGVDPDKGNGSVEWLVILILLAITVALVAGAHLEWCRAQLAER